MPEFGLSDKTLTTVRSILASCQAVDKAVLYGSRAKGNFKPGSDLDITLIGAGITPRMLADLAGKFEDSAIPYQVDLSIQADIDNPNLLDHIARVGVVFYERTDTLTAQT